MVVDFKLEKLIFFSEIVTQTTVGLTEIGWLFSGLILIPGWNLPYLEVHGV